VAIRAVVFDVGGILEISPSLNVEEKWEPEFGAEFHVGLSEIWSAGSVGAMTLDQVHEEIGRIVGAGPDRVAAFMEDIWAEYLGELNQDMWDYLSEVRGEGYKVAVISNSFVGAREREEERYGFSQLTDFIIYSHEVGFSKPDPRIYTLCLDQLGLEPDQVVFLDDSEITVAGARAMGMHGVVYERDRQAMKDMDKILDR